MRKIEAAHNKLLTKQQEKINRIHERAQEVIYYYRKINQRVRPDHAKPASFEKEHKLDADFTIEEESRQSLDATTQLHVRAVSK